ncbi:LysR family transcriptional regulator [Primorskyibacter sp. S187A]|uniref:LysR family transcriptional regulator n=1 Tax=Primorskyibacter sp. S187A TaxID=3415130 RepID=UPI003C7BF57F
MLPKGVTLRGLEVFDALAQTGSVAQAARMTGLSQPAVSQQMKNLESALGTDLLDHTRRPMQLTPAGRSYHERTQAVLRELRLAQSELVVMDLSDISLLNLGMIDDFDNDVTPRLATLLAESLTRCTVKLITGSSYGILDAVSARNLHAGVAASTGDHIENVREYPLMSDPFVLVAPRDAGADTGRITEDLPFIRYDAEQLIARQIAAHFAREQLMPPSRFEIGAHLALMALVARGAGWALTTAAGYMRAARMHDTLAAHPLPTAPFSRTLSLFAAEDWSDDVPRDVGSAVRQLMQEQVIIPGETAMPWLKGALRVLD